MDLDFITQLLIIIGIDLVLGGDNAIVIALACRNLPESQRNKAIIMGTGLAIMIRIFLTVIAVYLLGIPYLQLIGGLLLIWIAYQLLAENENDTTNIKAGTTLFQAVRTIVFADIVMGFDNVLAIAGAAEGEIILVVLGLFVSIPIIIWGSKLILILMERFSIFVYIGAGILAYTAGTMIINEKKIAMILSNYQSLTYLIPIITISIVIGTGWLSNHIKQKYS